MPDAFFASTKARKRKRSTTTTDAPSSASKRRPHAKPSADSGAKKALRTKKPRRDEELSDKTDDEGMDIDDMDLKGDRDEQEPSDDEYENETPAEKRLRLAKLYLESVKNTLGAYFQHTRFLHS